MVAKGAGLMTTLMNPHRTIPVIILAFLAVPAEAATAWQGKYVCTYSSMVGCGPPGEPGSVCIGHKPNAGDQLKYKLILDFERRPSPFISLNGLEGRLKKGETDDQFTVVWAIPGLGKPAFSMAGDEYSTRATLANADPRGSDSSVFECERAL